MPISQALLSDRFRLMATCCPPTPTKRRAWGCRNCDQVYTQRRCPDHCSNCCHRKGYEPRWCEVRIPAKSRRSVPGLVPGTRRERVYERDGYRCVNCAEDDRDLLTLDHIRPKSKGGTNAMSNLQTLCKDCNQRKADLLPEPGETYPRLLHEVRGSRVGA